MERGFCIEVRGAVAIHWFPLGGEMGLSAVLRVWVWTCGGGGVVRCRYDLHNTVRIGITVISI